MDSFDALRRDISDLGHLLGDVLVEQEGAQLLELEEKIRALAKERRRETRRGPAAKQMQDAIEALDTGTAEQLARAFTHYFQLVNLAEQHHRTRRRRDYARAGQVQEGTFAHELGRIGATRDELQAVLAATKIELVFTAHPSEAQRRTVLEKHRRIADLLARRDRSDLTPEERTDTSVALREEVTSLWQTDELRREKPLVADEVKNTLFYLEEVLFPLVPSFYEALESAAAKVHGPLAIPRILTFGSWVGGDMDGNPNVTPQVALDTAFAMGARILQLYLNEISRLGSVLSQSRRRVQASSELPDSIEPYRAELTKIAAKLAARRDVLIAGRRDKSTAVDYGADAYLQPEELLADLAAITRSLEEN
jgi:phosphoenolpyruvate carboxylase